MGSLQWEREIVVIIIIMIMIIILNSYIYIVTLVPKDLKLVCKQGSFPPTSETVASEGVNILLNYLCDKEKIDSTRLGG